MLQYHITLQRNDLHRMDNAAAVSVDVPARSYRLLDGVAVCLSMLCLVHCLALPVLVASLPLLAASMVANERFHLWMLLAIVPTSVLALGSGFRTHRLRAPLVLGGLGVCLIASAAFGPDVVGMSRSMDTELTVIGGLMLATAHGLNYRRLHAGHLHAFGGRR